MSIEYSISQTLYRRIRTLKPLLLSCEKAASVAVQKPKSQSGRLGQLMKHLGGDLNNDPERTHAVADMSRVNQATN